MSTYFFCIDGIQVAYQKGKIPDSDWLTLTATVYDTVTRTKTSRSVTHHLGRDICSGQTRMGLWPGVGVHLSEGEIVCFSFMITNLATTAVWIQAALAGGAFGAAGFLKRSDEEVQKLGAEGTERAIAEAGTETFTAFKNGRQDFEDVANKVKEYSATAGELTSLVDPTLGEAIKSSGEDIAEIAKTILGGLEDVGHLLSGDDTPNCDGIVLADGGNDLAFDENQLRNAFQRFSARGFTPGQRGPYEGPQQNAKCGHAPVTTVLWSIRGRPLSLRSNFALRGLSPTSKASALAPGVRSLSLESILVPTSV